MVDNRIAIPTEPSTSGADCGYKSGLETLAGYGRHKQSQGIGWSRHRLGSAEGHGAWLVSPSLWWSSSADGV